MSRPEIPKGDAMSKNTETEIVSEIAPEAAALTPKELAAELGIDPKSLRRIMRSIAAETPGAGARWEIGTDFADTLRQRVSRSHNRKVVRFTPKS